jgi:hypothetical protein
MRGSDFCAEFLSGQSSFNKDNAEEFRNLMVNFERGRGKVMQ